MRHTSEDVDLRQMWNVINRSKWGILSFAAVVTVLAALATFALAPVYRASATILIESQEANVVSIEEVYGLENRNEQYYETQFGILRSRPLAEAVVAKLTLLQHPEFSPESGQPLQGWRSRVSSLLALGSAEAPAEPLEAAVEVYTQNLAIEPVRNTQLVDVHFDSRDPKLAARVANEHAQAYIDSTLEARVAVTESAAAWLSERLAGMQQDLLEAETRLQAFREQERLVDAEGLRALPAREVNELSSRLVEVRQTLSLAEIAYLQVDQLLDGPSDLLVSIPAVRTDSVVQELQSREAEAEQRVAELEERYGPLHPSMVAARSELSTASQSLRSQTKNVAEAIRNEYEAAKAEEKALLEALESSNQRYQDVGRKESELLALQREVENQRRLYDLFYSRVSETAETEDLQPVNARVVSPAVVPRVPAKPNKRLIVLLALAASLIAGILVAFLRDSLDNTLRRAVDVEDELELPLLAAVPRLRDRRLRGAKALGRAAVANHEWGFSEAIRTLRTGLSLGVVGNPHKVVLVASSAAGEGKSTIALNLAYVFAQAERVLVVEADMRRPRLAEDLKLPRGNPGLSALLAGEARLSKCIARDSTSGLDLLPAGATPPDPLQLLTTGRLVNVFRVLRAKYDRIIVDTPPVLPVSDAAVLSAQADTVIFVALAGSTPVVQIKRGLEQLQRCNARVSGIVLNEFDFRSARKYGDYGYGGEYGPRRVPAARAT